ncbi:MAG: BT_3928 family protein [Bacteroidota bacterium]
MKIINRIISLLVGGLFVFSGLIKLNDPVGTEIKLEEYFEVFATDQDLGLSALQALWEFLLPYSLTLAIILSVLEVVLGLGLILNYRPKSNLWSLLFMIVFFTFLTFYSAYFNKVTDCGCFGDAIKLTPWQSFTKDIILLVLIVWLFFHRGSLAQMRPLPFASTLSLLGSLGSLALALYCYYHLPILDFRAYKVGTNVPASMQPSEELQYGPEQYFYLNKESGEEEIYSTEEFTKDWKRLSDTNQYSFVKLDKPILNPEAQPKITDYSAIDPDGNDVTEMTFKGDKMLIIITDVRKVLGNVAQVQQLVDDLQGTQIEPIVLTASDYESFEAFRHQVQLAIPYYFVDKTVLKTMIRSDPGFIRMKDGIILAKWHYNQPPGKEELGS